MKPGCAWPFLGGREIINADPIPMGSYSNPSPENFYRPQCSSKRNDSVLIRKSWLQKGFKLLQILSFQLWKQLCRVSTPKAGCTCGGIHSIPCLLSLKHIGSTHKSSRPKDERAKVTLPQKGRFAKMCYIHPDLQMCEKRELILILW